MIFLYGSEKDIKHNLILFFIDGVIFMPAMTLISVSTVIPYFLEQLGAATFQIALAASVALICNFVAQPFFGFVASNSKSLHKTFGKILLFQRVAFLMFVLCIPLISGFSPVLIWFFLFFWGMFNFFVGSYNVFFTPILIKLLPPNKRGAIRGIGFAAGSCLGLGAAALIRNVLVNVAFPYNYVIIFSSGIFLLLIDAFLFFNMRFQKTNEAPPQISLLKYIRGMPAAVGESAKFRAMILSCMFLVAANSLLSYYTLYAIRVFNATETHIAALAALAVFSSAIGYIVFGNVVDRRGPKTTALISAIFIICAGLIALFTDTINFLFAAWVLANLGNSGYGLTASLLLGEVSPPERLPLYVGVYTTISLALSSAVLLLLAPALENLGFAVLFSTVLSCGLLSLLINIFVMHKRIPNKNP